MGYVEVFGTHGSPSLASMAVHEQRSEVAADVTTATPSVLPSTT